MKGCHPTKLIERDGEFYCGPYRVHPDGDYVSIDMVEHDAMTPKQRAAQHWVSEATYANATQLKLKRAGL